MKPKTRRLWRKLGQAVASTPQRVLEGVVDLISPAAGLRRRIVRAQAPRIERLAGESYTGAKKGRLRGGWNPGGGSADEDILADLPTLRERSRDLVRNNALAAGLMQTLVDNVVGIGFRPQPAPRPDHLPGISTAQTEAWAVAARVAWDRWAETPDLAGRMDWPETLRLLCRSTFESGDTFPHYVFKPRPGVRYATAIEILEGDMVATPNNLVTDTSIRGGVKVGTRGQTLGFWVHKNHPGFKALSAAPTTDDLRFIRVFNPATGRRQILQVMFPQRPGQNRGVPLFAPVLGVFDDLQNLIESEVVATRVAACISAVIKRAQPLTTATFRGDAAPAGTDGRWEEFSPGQIEYLDPGEEFTLVNPQRPGSTFDLFLTRLIRTACRGVDLPYELGALDFQRTNYSSARAAMLEARRMFKCKQAGLKRFCQITYELVIEEAWQRGDLPGLDLEMHRDELMRTSWTTPGWGWVDPVKEIDASAKAIALGVSTLAIEAETYTNQDWREILRQRVIEITETREAHEEAGNPLPPAPGEQPAQAPQPAAANDDDDDDDDDDDEEKVKTPRRQTAEARS